MRNAAKRPWQALVTGSASVLFALAGKADGAMEFSSGVQVGTIQHPAVEEASGLAASRANVNVLWTHNDYHYNPGTIYAMSRAGTNLGAYTIAGATAEDWEDIAVGPGPVAGQQYVYVADTGDNHGPGGTANRPSVQVYRVAEPAVGPTQQPVAVTLTDVLRIDLVFPDGPRDVESLMVDPGTSDIYLVAKRGERKRIYRAPYAATLAGSPVTLQFVADFDFADHSPTAGDISPSGGEILIRSRSTAVLFVRPQGGGIADAFGTTPHPVPLRTDLEPAGEGIAWAPDGLGYYTTTEGLGAPISYYAAVLMAGDANGDGLVNVDDYVLIDRGYARYLAGSIPAGGAGWHDGDFNYDGSVGSADYLLIDTAFVGQGGSLSLDLLSAREAQFGADYVAALVAAVPEPASPALLGLAIVGLTCCRRRR